MNNELYHYGVPGMKWGHRKQIDSAGEGVVTRRKKKTPVGGINPNAGKPSKTTSGIALETGDKISKGLSKIRNAIKKRTGGEISKRGKAALDVLMNGDKDWMGNSISSDDAVTEARNRGKAALERLMYSQERIDNKKFFGSYDPFD